MRSPAVPGDPRTSLWLRVRQYAVPPSMIESATARRLAGDWAGACAAAHVDVDVGLRAAGRAHGREFATRLRADLRRLAPDLLRWHMPRIAPDGLLRPGLTAVLARYPQADLVVRTPPSWADAGQRMSLALWSPDEPAHDHPHPRPDPRHRLDLHRHLWDASRSGELPTRPGTVGRWPAEAAILLRALGRTSGTVAVRLPGGRRLVHVGEPAPPGHRLPVLPYAATWPAPDLQLLRAGAISPEQLHPLVAAALAPDAPPASTTVPATVERLVDCQAGRHRIAVVDGVLTPLDHDPAELRLEELLTQLGGSPLPCLRAIDEAHRNPECLPDVRARLDHGDVAGALGVVEALLGPAAALRTGALREELETLVHRRITHGLFRAGLTNQGPPGRPDRRAAAATGPRVPEGSCGCGYH